MLAADIAGNRIRPPQSSHVVAMLVGNPGYTDARVRKEAEALVERGLDVHVLGVVQLADEQGVERINGVVYHRLWHPLRRGTRFPIGMFVRSVWMSFKGGHYTLVVAAGTVVVAILPSFLMFVLQLILQICGAVLRRLLSVSARFRHLGVFGKLRGTGVFRRLRGYGILGKLRSWREHHSSVMRQHVYRLARDSSVLLSHLTFVALYADTLSDIRPSVVHAHDLITLPAGAVCAGANGGKLIYDAHELEMHRNVDYASWVNKYRYGFEKIGIQQADGVITVSECIAGHLAEVYGVFRPTVVFNTPVSLTSASLDTVRSVLRMDNETPLIVYVGSVTVNRGIENMVTTLSYIPDYHFALVGPRNEQVAESVRKSAKDSRVSDRIHFVDPVPPEDVPSFISGADLSVLPIQNVCLSYEFCMPNKLFESVFSGLPVVVSNLVEMRRFVEKTRVGMVADETDPADMADKIRSVYVNRDWYRKNRSELECLLEEYGWIAQRKKIYKLYDAVTSGKNLII